MLQSSRREEAARTCVRGVAGKSRRRRKVQSSRKRHRQKRSWRRCVGASRGQASQSRRVEASQRRYERALLHEQSEEQFTIVHLAYPWALRVSCQSDRSCSLVRRQRVCARVPPFRALVPPRRCPRDMSLPFDYRVAAFEQFTNGTREPSLAIPRACARASPSTHTPPAA